MIPSSGCPPWPPDHPRTLPRAGAPTPLPGTRPMNATKRLVTPILILHDTAKAFYAQELEGGGGWPSLWAPSLAVDGISSDYLRLLDATVRDAPVDLLILAAREGPSYLKGGLDEVLAWAKETAEDEYFNPHYRLLARLTGDYLKEAGAIRLPAFRQLIAIVSGAELFHEDGLHPGLIDVLPSLIGRTEELLERRVAFDSVGEESPGPVIKGSGA